MSSPWQTPEQAEAVYKTAKKVEGLNRSMRFSRSNVLRLRRRWNRLIGRRIEGKSRRRLPAPGRVDTRVRQILDDRAIARVCQAAKKDTCGACRASTLGVKRIINWLLLPETEYLAIRSQVF
jgi:hypothetical protein